MPEHHEVADVLLAVEFGFGEPATAPVLLDLVVDLGGSRLQYRASGLGHVDLFFGMVGGHGGWREKGIPGLRSAIISMAVAGWAYWA